MAHPDHIEILRRGPQAWNAWRSQNPSILPHLSDVTLKLSERQWGPIHGGPINLNSALLRDASLRFASLLDADLQAANLSRANLVHARLDRANLKNAILVDAVLDYADFANAQLGRAILSGASLSHARNLTQDQIEDAIGDASTTLPAHLNRPSAWLKVAVDNTIGDVPTTLPSHFNWPSAWLKVAAESSRAPSPTFSRAVMAVGAAACAIAGVIIFANPRAELEPTAQTTNPISLAPSDLESSQFVSRSTATPDSASSPSRSADGTGEPTTPTNTTATPQVQSPPIDPRSTPAEPAVTANTDQPAQKSESAAGSSDMTPLRVTTLVGTTIRAQGAPAHVELQGPTVAAVSPRSEQPSLSASSSLALNNPNELENGANVGDASVLLPNVEATPPLPERKPVVVGLSPKSKVARPAYVEPQPGEARRSAALPQPRQVNPTSSTADVLAGGL